MAAGPVPSAVAGLVPGGGPKRSDCYIEEDVAGVDSPGNVIRCLDGAAACDTDGVPDYACVFKVALCANQTNLPGCAPGAPLRKVVVKSVPKGVRLRPPADLSGGCGPATDVVVPMKVTRRGKRLPGKVKLLVSAITSGKRRRDRDRLVLTCEPCLGCEPCPQNPSGGPDMISLSSGETGTDLDNGWTGIAHNFPAPPRASLSLCLSGCDASTNPMCDATGPTGTGSLNGETFGPPLPLIAQGVPVCVLNAYQPGYLTAKINVQTGEILDSNPLAVDLSSKVHLTSGAQVCPRCVGNGAPEYGRTGTCDAGPAAGAACTVDSVLTVVESQGNPVYGLSKTCIPSPSQLAGTVDIRLRLTTGVSMLQGPKPCTAQPGEPAGVPVQDDNCNGTPCDATCTGNACVRHDSQGRCIDAKGGISQVCCAGNTLAPCFPTAGGGSIVRMGNPDPAAPVWPDPSYPKVSTNAVLVATFCEPSTGTTTVDATAGLPGPGALILPGTAVVLKVN